MIDECEDNTMSYFIHFLPMEWINRVASPETNKNLSHPFPLGELLTFIGMWLLITMCPGLYKVYFFLQNLQACAKEYQSN